MVINIKKIVNFCNGSAQTQSNAIELYANVDITRCIGSQKKERNEDGPVFNPLEATSTKYSSSPNRLIVTAGRCFIDQR